MPPEHALPASRPVGRIVATVLVVVLAVLASVAFFTERWLFSTWASLSVDELLYHLQVSLEGTGSNMIVGFLVQAGIPILVVLALIACVLALLRKHPAGYRGALCLVAIASVAALGYAAFDLNRNMGVAAYIEDVVAPSDEDFIAENYVDPASVDIRFPAKKRNLVYIFCESLETTFSDRDNGGGFEVDVIPEMTALAQENEDFSGSQTQIDGAFDLPGSEWTMGGMFAQTSALPLKLPLGGNSLQFAEEFFPDITTLGDILDEQGYRQVLMVGSDATFGGRRLYFTQHGGYEIKDYAVAKSLGMVTAEHEVDWGFNDELLFEWARQELEELGSTGEPFNLTLLTVDTHFPDGFPCRLCKDEFGDNQYANVYACSSRQIASFVEWIGQQDFADDTTIVINGDHRTMDPDFCNDMAPGYERRTFTCVVNAQASLADAKRTRAFSTFDLFPTTLAALGATIEGDRLGLGANLYGSHDTLVEEFGKADCARKLQRHSDFLDAYSGETITEEDLEVVSGGIELQQRVQPDGHVQFYAFLSSVINVDWVEEFALEITDTRTGKTERASMQIVPDPADPNVMRIMHDTAYRAEDLPYLEATLRITVPGIEDYALLTFEKGEMSAS